MRSTVALEAKEKGREANNLIGPKFEDTSTCLVSISYYDSRDRIEILCPCLDSESSVSAVCLI